MSNFMVGYENQFPSEFKECFVWLSELEGFQAFLKTKENDLVMFHLTVGMALRNEFKLWYNSPLTDYFNSIGIFHADDMSEILLTSLHRLTNGKVLDISGQAKFYKDYWLKEKQNSLK